MATIFLLCFNYCWRFLCVIYFVDDGLLRGALELLLFYMQCERDCGFNSGRDAHWPDLSMKIKARLIVIYAAESLPRHLSPTVNKLCIRKIVNSQRKIEAISVYVEPGNKCFMVLHF